MFTLYKMKNSTPTNKSSVKYKELSFNLLCDLYQNFHKNPKNKELVIDCVYSQEDPNNGINKADVLFGKFIPNGDLEEKKKMMAKKSVIHKDYLLTKNSLPTVGQNDFYYIPCKLKYTSKNEWIDSSLQVCNSGTIAINYLDISLWIKEPGFRPTK